MANPYLPQWEYIPDGEPRVFGDRVYIYGSHDAPQSDKFCDGKLKVWSASVHNLNDWVCHGDIFHTRADSDHPSDTDWTDGDLYAPDVVEKDGKYYLFDYIFGAKGCVAVSERPEGPFRVLSRYQYKIPQGRGKEYCNDGWFIDPGVLVDDDGSVHICCGYERSFYARLNPDNMYEVLDGTYQDDIIPVSEPFNYFEACSMRKIGNVYYLIYSNRKSSQLVYATADRPQGPYRYRGVIIDNGIDYPAGNNHGSLCCINGQWYIFYHRMTNGTIMSRQACVEKVSVAKDGTIAQVEMTSLGFEESLSPYKTTEANIACVLKGGCIVAERDVFTRMITKITDGCVMGYRYFDFGEDHTGTRMTFCAKVRGNGCRSLLHIRLDSENGTEIGNCEIGGADGIYSAKTECVTGRHAIYFVAESRAGGWFKDMFDGRHLFEFESFVFTK